MGPDNMPEDQLEEAQTIDALMTELASYEVDGFATPEAEKG